MQMRGTSLAKITGRNIPGQRNGSYKGPSKEEKLGVVEETKEQCGFSQEGEGIVVQDSSS